MANECLLEVRNLAVSFSQYGRGLKRRILHPIRDLSLFVRKGEMTAVVGASGSGKSLLAHAVLGILPYNCRMDGELFYKGQVLDRERIHALRGNEIALIPQGVSYLDPLMKIGPQIRNGKNNKASRLKCQELLGRYGLEPQVEALYPFELSGGMARRVLIASALMEEPDLVIADEPTPGLDQKTALRVIRHFKEISDAGAGVLLITHDLELAVQTADRILVFYEGAVIEEAMPEQFQSEARLKHPYTKALYRAMPEHGFAVWNELEQEDKA